MGRGGVVVTSESQRGRGAVAPSRLSADDLTGEFGPGSRADGDEWVGQASIEETTAKGARQTTSGDRLEAQFACRPAQERRAQSTGQMAARAQIQSALVEGHVVLTQKPAAKPGAQPPATLRATAGRADTRQGEWLHLTLNPRVEDGALQMTADKLDVSRASGDAFAHGNVKASWTDTEPAPRKQGRPAAIRAA